MSSLTLSRTIAATIFTILASYALWESHAPFKRKQRLRRQVAYNFFFYLGCSLIADYNKQLPTNLDRWRQPATAEDEEQIWRYLDEALRDAGFTLWTHFYASVFMSPGVTYPLSSGFGYAIPSRTDTNGVGTVGILRQFMFPVCWVYKSILSLSDIYEKNGSSRPVRTREGLDVVIRVIVIGDEGKDHLKLLRTIATGENSLFSNNHTLPMFAEFQFEDIIFGIFPKVGGEMFYAYGYWAKNSVGDIIEMLMQMLEVSFTFHVLPLLFNLNLRLLHLFMT